MKMIFHLPNYIDLNHKSASQIRPLKMYEAFNSLGYEVDLVQGYGAERKKKIKEILSKISSGVRYDFCYSESSTMPTLLTEKHHLPTYPRLDFGFFSRLKGSGIPIGLFYRDIHWKFPLYKESLSALKYKLAISMYEYDLKKYGELLDILYLPSTEMSSYLPGNLNKISKSLPPGAEIYGDGPKDFSRIKMVYVGGLGSIYNLTEFLQAVYEDQGLTLKLVCRENEWERSKEAYGKYIGKNVEIIHTSGEGLQKIFSESNLGVLALAPQEYLDFAIPYKLYEYLGAGLPVLASQGTASGSRVKDGGFGFVAEDNKDSYLNFFKDLRDDLSKLQMASEKSLLIRKDNTWEARSRQVVEDLLGDK